jgi:hypothetical protein
MSMADILSVTRVTTAVRLLIRAAILMCVYILSHHVWALGGPPGRRLVRVWKSNVILIIIIVVLMIRISVNVSL